jgi:hypothetical protein
MMLLTVSHGLLFNNSRCGVRHSLLTRAGGVPARNSGARPAILVRLQRRAPSGDDLVATVLNILVGRGPAAAWLTFSSRAVRGRRLALNR